MAGRKQELRGFPYLCSELRSELWLTVDEAGAVVPLEPVFTLDADKISSMPLSGAISPPPDTPTLRHIHAFTCMHTYTVTHTHSHTHIHTLTHIHARTHNVHTLAYTHTLTHTLTHTHILDEMIEPSQSSVHPGPRSQVPQALRDHLSLLRPLIDVQMQRSTLQLIPWSLRKTI